MTKMGSSPAVSRGRSGTHTSSMETELDGYRNPQVFQMHFKVKTKALVELILCENLADKRFPFWK